MKFSINTTILLKGLDNVQSIVEKRHITPILSNVRIQARTDKLLLNGTDNDLDILEFLDASITVDGETTAPVHKLFETIKKLPPNSMINFELVENILHLECGHFKGKLNCLSVEDFPITPKDNLPVSFQVVTSELKFLLEKTKIAVALDDSRHYLMGICLHVVNKDGIDMLRTAATDGHKMALADIPLPNDEVGSGSAELKNIIKELPSIIIPKKAVDEVYKLIEKQKEDVVKLSLSKTKITFKFTHITLTSKLIDGQFPKYDNIIPKNNTIILELNRVDFLNKVNLVSTYSDDKIRTIKLEIKNNILKIIAEDQGDYAEEEIELKLPSVVAPADTNSTDSVITTSIADLTIGFNAKYLVDICSQIKQEEFVITLLAPSTPALIKKKELDDEIYVLMPMRI